MRKKELVCIHALFQEVTGYLIEDDGLAVQVHPAYDALDVRPSSIHKPKRNHSEAISILGESLESSLEHANTETPDQPAR